VILDTWGTLGCSAGWTEEVKNTARRRQCAQFLALKTNKAFRDCCLGQQFMTIGCPSRMIDVLESLPTAPDARAYSSDDKVIRDKPLYVVVVE